MKQQKFRRVSSASVARLVLWEYRSVNRTMPVCDGSTIELSYLRMLLSIAMNQKTATAVAFVKKGAGLIKVNGVPISLLQPEILKLKTFEPVLLIGTDKFANVSNIRNFNSTAYYQWLLFYYTRLRVCKS